jgi:hypothetical protein
MGCVSIPHIRIRVHFLTPHSEGHHLLPAGRLVVVGNQAYHCCVVRNVSVKVPALASRLIFNAVPGQVIKNNYKKYNQ